MIHICRIIVIVTVLVNHTALQATCQASDTVTKEPAITVECSGTLEHGRVSVGGEATGTTVTSGGMTWELNLSTDALRSFVALNNKKPVTVIGSFKKVEGVEGPAREIIDVRKITERQPTEKDGAIVTFKGKLRTGIISVGGETTGTTISADGVTWELDFKGDAKLIAKSESMSKKRVIASGKVERVRGVEVPDRTIIHVCKLELAAE